MDLMKTLYLKNYFNRKRSKRILHIFFEEELKSSTSCLVNLQVNSYADAHWPGWWPYHCVIPLYRLTDSEPRPPSDIKFHPIKKDVSYRFWNPVSNGLMQRVDQNVTCSGGFFSPDPDSK